MASDPQFTMPKYHNDILQRISENDHWYKSFQFEDQWQNPSVRGVILNRWHIWTEFISRWWDTHYTHFGGQTLKVLDAGCGDGINLMGLQNVLGQIGFRYSLEGVDYNPLRVERAAERFAEISIVQADLLNLPYENNSVHVVLCNHVLEHIREDVAAMAELRRILHPNGMLIIGVPNEGCFLAQVRNRFLQRQILRTTDHVNFYTEGSLRHRAMSAGLVMLDIRCEGFFLPYLPISSLIRRSSLGRGLVSKLGAIFPSQAADLIVATSRCRY
jgi:2-polyprenyl-3-methyl-5-hydroxy-6-metoxy-1,4-benzoquinol methylase